MSLIKVENLHKNFACVEVLKGIDLSVEKGEVTALLGASGSGKSTLLRCLNLLEKPSCGRIFFEDEEITAPGLPEKAVNRIRMKMGMVFQQFNLFPHLTILRNICLSPILNMGIKEAEAREMALGLLARVGLTEKAEAYPHQLSGGQKQRVAIARALAMKPDVMLFDEPTSALDPEMVKEVLSVIQELAETGMTILIVTHEMRFARNVASRILFLDEGVLAADQNPEDFFQNTQSARIRSFLNLVT